MRRRDFLKTLTLLPLSSYGCARFPFTDPGGTVLNDIHSRLNATRVKQVVPVRSAEDISVALAKARRERLTVSIAGGRHAMGGQQFAEGALHLDTTPLGRVLGFDDRRGLIEVEAGCQWPKLVSDYLALQQGHSMQWGFTQKQTGADNLSIGGAVSANAHGRSLVHKPIVEHVRALTLINAEGDLVRCSREENADLFRLVVGGYGLFGVLYSVTLQLTERKKLERIVEIVDAADVPELFRERIRSGFTFGDFQFTIDPASPDYLTRGVFACYRPVDPSREIPSEQRELAPTQWRDLIMLAHTDKKKAFERYAAFYTSTNGQLYWSDTHQMSYYPDGYHLDVDRLTGTKGSEMISEIYVPRDVLPRFLEETAASFRRSATEVIYGTVRLIERDDETFLPWARESYACVVFNLHVEHHANGIASAQERFRALIDLARKRGGSYFLTYHRWARHDQLLDCYPQFPRFLELKREFDPQERFQSEWYRHYKIMLSNKAA